jgi:hypothetical protein
MGGAAFSDQQLLPFDVAGILRKELQTRLVSHKKARMESLTQLLAKGCPAGFHAVRGACHVVVLV